MANNSDVRVAVKADAKQALAELDRAAQAVRNIAKQMDDAAKTTKKADDEMKKAAKDAATFGGKIKAASSKANKALESVQKSAQAVTAAFAAGGAAYVVKSLFDTGVAAVVASAKMKQYEIAFTTMLKSADKGRALLDEMQHFAQVTPFDVEGVVEAGQKLLAFGFDAKEVIPVLTTVGDAAAGLGKSSEGVSQMAYALGQMKSAGTLKTEDINILVNAGISAWEMLADASGKSIAEIKDMTSRGMIDGAVAVAVLLKGMNARFGGMMDKTAKELTGLWANVGVTVGMIAADVGQSIADGLNVKGALAAVGDQLNAVQQKFAAAKKEGKGFAAALAAAVPAPVLAILGALGAVLAGVVVAGFYAAAAAALAFVAASVPILGTVAAVGAAVGACVALVAIYWDEMQAGAKVAWENFANIITATLQTVVGTVLKAVEQITFAVGAIGRALHFDVSGIDALHDSVDQKQLEMFKKAADSINEIGDSAARYEKELAAIRAANVAPVVADDSGAAVKGGGAPVDLTGNATGNAAPGGGGGGGGRSGGAAGVARDFGLSQVVGALDRADDATKKLAADFKSISEQVSADALSGSAKVYAEIEKQKNERLAAIDDVLDRQRAAVAEAATIKAQAEATGNAEAIAAANELYTTRNALLSKSEQDAAAIREQALQTAYKRAVSFETQMAAARADVQEAMNAKTFGQFCEMLDNEKVANMAAIQEEQALRQQYLDWQLEANQSILDFTLEAAETVRQQLAAGFADCIVNGQKFGDVLKKLGKQIFGMFIQWVAGRELASVMGKLFAKKDAATSTAAAGIATAAWKTAAIAKETVVPGSIARAAVTVSGVLAASAAGGGVVMGESISARANGGYTAPGWTLVGERGPELVNFGKPSRVYTAAETSRALSGAYAEPNAAGGGSVAAVMNNYGDINNAADLFDLLSGFENVVAAGVRGC